MTTLSTKNAATALAALGLVGSLAGCATAVGGGATGDSADLEADTGSQAADTYADGSYTATGSYQSPGGTESITVTLALAGNEVTDVSVETDPATNDSANYQRQFAEGIAAEVVGKDVDSLSVDRVGGSSLTSGGFNDALEQIKAEALA
jgi:uncharacterized protein with FMN-binding domain